MQDTPPRRLQRLVRTRGRRWTDAEKDAVVEGVRVYGHQWSKIAAEVGGRSAKDVCNQWKAMLIQAWPRKWECLATEADVDEAVRVRAPRPPVSKAYKPWTDEEKAALREGVKEYGTRWSAILRAAAYKDKLRDRTRLCLKNRWTNERGRAAVYPAAR